MIKPPMMPIFNLNVHITYMYLGHVHARVFVLYATILASAKLYDNVHSCTEIALATAEFWLMILSSVSYRERV